MNTDGLTEADYQRLLQTQFPQYLLAKSKTSTYKEYYIAVVRIKKMYDEWDEKERLNEARDAKKRSWEKGLETPYMIGKFSQRTPF